MLVAFTGRKGHGKTTAAGVLLDRGFRHINFADPVRKVVHEVYGVSYEEMSDPALKDTPLNRWPYRSPREIMTQVGTEMFRQYLPETWTKWLERAVAKARAEGHFDIACSDVRFLNEADTIWRLDGSVHRVVDPRKPADDQHVSETEMALIKPDTTFINSTTVADLRASVASRFLES